ncbi:ChbG/HpnK family deacetylase [Lactobacillus delbrueckii subsp. bulgaricus]
MRRILLRADDLGYSRAVNYGILDSVEYGLVNNVGIMTNMESTAEAVDWLKDKEIDLGVHINLTNGRPLSTSSEVPNLVNENGEFHRSSVYRENMVKGIDLLQTEQAITEIEQQYLQFVKLTGRQPDYFEGHAISSNNFRTALEFVADKYDLPYLELPKTTEMISPFKRDTLFYSKSSVINDFRQFYFEIRA